MNKLFLLSAIILFPSITFAGDQYELTGKINGIRISKDTCHISFETDNNPYYSKGWHYSDGESICKIAQLAYIIGKDVRATGEVNTDNILYANTIKDIIVGVQGIHWPPYHEPD